MNIEKNVLLNPSLYDGYMDYVASPGFPSYYTTINEIMNIMKYLSFGVLIVLIIFMIIRKAKHKTINKGLIITSIILLIVGIVSSFIKMPTHM